MYFNFNKYRQAVNSQIGDIAGLQLSENTLNTFNPLIWNHHKKHNTPRNTAKTIILEIVSLYNN